MLYHFANEVLPGMVDEKIGIEWDDEFDRWNILLNEQKQLKKGPLTSMKVGQWAIVGKATREQKKELKAEKARTGKETVHPSDKFRAGPKVISVFTRNISVFT